MQHKWLQPPEWFTLLIRERVRSGLANARAKGKRLGRPCATTQQVDKGLSLDQAGRNLPSGSQAIRGQYFHAAACPQKNTGCLTVENQAGEASPRNGSLSPIWGPLRIRNLKHGKLWRVSPKAHICWL